MTPNASGTFQRSLSTASNESGMSSNFKFAYTSTHFTAIKLTECKQMILAFSAGYCPDSPPPAFDFDSPSVEVLK